MLDIVGSIVLILELVLISFIVFYSYKNKIIFSKKNLMYFTPVFLICFTLYLTGVFYQDKTLNIFNIADSICYAIYSFAFRVDKDLVGLAVNDSLIFYVSFTIAILLSGLTMISTVLSLVKMNISNYFNVQKKKRNNADIVLGYNENSIEYVKRNPSSILWINANEVKINNDEKNKLFSKKITFINKSFDKNKVKSFLSNKKGNIHFIVFCENKDKIEYTKYIEIFTYEKIKTRAIVYLHIEAKNEYINFVNNQMSTKAINSNYELIATCFNTHELLARRFIMNNTYLDHLPKDKIENGLLKDDINVFFLGFGKTNFSMFKACLLNNQFVEEKDGKFYNKKVNYYLYDSTEEVFNNELLARLEMDYYKKKVDSKVSPIEKICNLKTKKMNIKSSEFINEVNGIINDKSHNIFFVSFKEGVENASFAEVLGHYFKDKSIYIYYNVDSDLEVLDVGDNALEAFGFKNSILNHSIIANDSLADEARGVNKEYRDLNTQEMIKWEKLPVVEKYSNVYHSINMKFKLQIMGVNYQDYLNKKLTKEEYEKILFEGKSNEVIFKLKEYSNYQDYFEINLRNALAFQEHLRWVCYYYVNNFDQMPTKDIRFENGKLITKNMIDKSHCCITTYYGLDTLHKKMVELYKEHGIEKTINDVETYKYDYMVFDNLFK